MMLDVLFGGFGSWIVVQVLLKTLALDGLMRESLVAEARKERWRGLGLAMALWGLP